jgi:hypothetical protein
MTIRINSAYRVHKVLANAAKKNQNQPTGNVWAQVFNIEEPDETRRNFEISRCLNQLYDEINIFEKLMGETEFSEELYKPYLDRARQAIIPHGISNGWNSYCPNLSPDTILSLKFCEEILPEEELAVDQNDIEEIEELVKDLETTLKDSPLPIHLKRIIEKHIVKIREAMYSYNIIGAKAMTDVVQSAYGEVFQNQNLFESEKSSEPIIKLSKVWQKVKQVAEGAITATDYTSKGIDLVEKGVKAIGFIEKILSST